MKRKFAGGFDLLEEAMAANQLEEAAAPEPFHAEGMPNLVQGQPTTHHVGQNLDRLDGVNSASDKHLGIAAHVDAVCEVARVPAISRLDGAKAHHAATALASKRARALASRSLRLDR